MRSNIKLSVTSLIGLIMLHDFVSFGVLTYPLVLRKTVIVSVSAVSQVSFPFISEQRRAEMPCFANFTFMDLVT